MGMACIMDGEWGMCEGAMMRWETVQMNDLYKISLKKGAAYNKLLLLWCLFWLVSA